MANLESVPPVAASGRVAWDNPLARVRWSAVWAGLVAASGLQILLAVLGAAIGISVLGDGRGSGVTLGAGIWLLVVLIISLFVGGLMAGRLAGVRTTFESLVHGTLVWALSLMIAAWLVGSAASKLFGGALSLAGGALTAAGQVAGGAASNPNAQSDLQRAVDQARRDAAQRGLTADSIRALGNNAAGRVESAAGEVAGQIHSAATGSAWVTLVAIVLAFFAAWLGAQRAMPHHDHGASVHDHAAGIHDHGAIV